ncbi:hypothetical protein WICPIJ_008770 [Wickerhamomyces pijperi]|uniref:Lysophospholipase n=1 Tax=Wickerhamomyces pijperi TaxID=599730 RepID=A0A9P8PWP0_WICPI|nr:hypothetical protein WICPIJ_008770 [Wickerhamomyces pijperi]
MHYAHNLTVNVLYQMKLSTEQTLALAIALSHFTSKVSAWSPTNGYAPGTVSCPSTDVNFLRDATGLSSEESDWLALRNQQTQPALKKFIERANFADFNIEEFFDEIQTNITIALSFSGGGYRAMLNGAGQLSALDERTVNATEYGLGGLFQSSTYLAGLSGGNWLTGSMALNNWSTIDELANNNNGVWDLNHSILDSGGLNIFSTLGRFIEIDHAVDAKKAAGFNTSITDIWGRALSYQFFGSDFDGYAPLTFSSIKDGEAFQNALVPFPISVADGRAPGTLVISGNSTIFEFNPFEMGTWDKSVHAFTDLEYLGTHVTNGKPDNSDICVRGFDNAGFVMGTSSSLFNQFLLQLNSTALESALKSVWRYFLSDLDKHEDDIAVYAPNPFFKAEYAASTDVADSEYLYLVDGGEDLQNIPIAPFIQPERDVDVIFAFDNSADTDDHLPDGASVVASYERQFGIINSEASFPYVPDTNTFLAHGLTTKPTFFGCYASNLTELSRVPPLVVYVPNVPYTTWSNTSTFKMSYDADEKRKIIQNGFEVSSRYNMTMDSEWRKCVSCAIMQRSLEALNEPQPAECKSCFDEYCWDGSVYSGDENFTTSVNYTQTGNSQAGVPDRSSITL